MKIDFSTVLLEIDGTNMKALKPDSVTPDAPQGVLVDVTLGMVATNAILSPDVDEKDGLSKMAAFQLAMLVNKGKDAVDLKAEQIVKIKEKIGKFHAPLVVGRAYEVLDGNSQEKPGR